MSSRCFLIVLIGSHCVNVIKTSDLRRCITFQLLFNPWASHWSASPEDVVKVALVGLGRAGHFHMESVLQLPGIVRLAWVIDIDTEKAKRIATEKGCRWSSSLDAALAGPDAVDAVIIASATDTHFPYIMQALNADKAVLAEKPISHELNEVVEAVELAKQKNLAFVCGYQRRADRHFRELKRQLDAGAIGNLKLLKTCSRDNPIPPMEYLRTSGGIFHDMLIHDFDMLDFLSGGQIPESVTATGHAYHPEIKAMGDVDTCAVMFKYPSGLIAMVDTSRDASYGSLLYSENGNGRGWFSRHCIGESFGKPRLCSNSNSKCNPNERRSKTHLFLVSNRISKADFDCALTAVAKGSRRSCERSAQVMLVTWPRCKNNCSSDF